MKELLMKLIANKWVVLIIGLFVVFVLLRLTGISFSLEIGGTGIHTGIVRAQ